MRGDWKFGQLPVLPKGKASPFGTPGEEGFFQQEAVVVRQCSCGKAAILLSVEAKRHSDSDYTYR
jgi:hypothetical protein